MPSQTDLDQGGTFRQTKQVYLGPSIGWVPAPDQTVLSVTTGGTTNVSPGNSVVVVNVNSNVTIQLPSAKGNAAGAGAVPGSWVLTPFTIIDGGGFAASHNITILPFGTEKIDGLASITIDSNYGLYQLRPRLETGGWTLAT